MRLWPSRRRKPRFQDDDWTYPATRPRVLVELDDVTELDTVSRILTEAGYDVATCEGPDRNERTQCLLPAIGYCTLVDRADVVYHGLRLTDENHREVLASLGERFPDTPVIVEAPAPALERYADLVQGHHVVRFPATREAVLEAVGSVLETPSGN